MTLFDGRLFCRCHHDRALHETGTGGCIGPGLSDEGCRCVRFAIDVYPITIITARYSGSYEGGRWCAFNRHHWDIPSEATGSDIECLTFWEGPAAALVGRGSTPDRARIDLERRLLDRDT